jgi:hypothetical protein
MNQRIQQLAEQAGMYVDLNGNPWPKWMSAEECEVAYKKFAELIVEDNLRILRSNGYDDAAQCLQDVHFGIDDPV